MAKDKVSISIEIEKIGKGLEEVKREISALANQVKTDGANIRREATEMTTGFNGLTSVIKAGTIALAAYYTAMKAARTIEEFINLSNRQEKSVAGLHQAMVSMGRYTPEYERKILGLASAYQDLTTFGDEAIIEGTKFLMTYRDIGDDVMPRAMRAMMDIAALMDGDMRSAANMVGKASMGMTGELRRAGITIDEGVAKSRGFIGILEQIEEQVSGQAKALRETGYGGLAVWGNLSDDVKEKIGDLIKTGLVPLAEATLPLLKDTIALLNDATRAARGYFASLKEGTVENLNQQLMVAKQRVKELQEAVRTGAQTQSDAILVAEGYGWMVEHGAKAQEELNKQLHEAEQEVLMLSAQIVALTEEEEKNIEVKKRLIDETKKLAEETRKYWEGVDLKAAIKEQEALDAWLGELDPLIAKHGELKEAINEVAEAAKWAANVRLKAAIEEQEALDEWLGDLDALKAKHGELTDEIKKMTTSMQSLWEDFQSTFQWSLEAGFADLFKGEMDGIGDYFKQFCDGLINAFARAVAKMIADWMTFKNLTSAGKGGWGWISSLFSGIAGLFGGGGGYNMQWGGMYQHGGLITEPQVSFTPSGRVNILGEAGPEAVIPLRNLGGRQEITTNIWLVDDRAKAPMPSKDDIVLVVSEDIQRNGPIRKTIKRFT